MGRVRPLADARKNRIMSLQTQRKCNDSNFRSSFVVPLTQEKCHQYWPAERSARYQYFVVDPMAEYNMPQYILREFKVTDARVSRGFLSFQNKAVRRFQPTSRL